MLFSRLTNCPQCADIPTLIADIDCKLSEMSMNLYNNVVFMLNKNVNGQAIMDLLTYRRILTYKYCNPDYAGHYTVNMIASKIQLLKFK